MDFLGNTCKKRSKTEKREQEHHHQIFYIRISLGSKFQLQQTIMTFWKKFAQKGCFQSKTD